MTNSQRFKQTKSGWKDAETGLTWSATTPKELAYAEAQAWCRSLGKGWRLPTINELISVVDYGRSAPATELPDTQPDVYWSSTALQYYPDFAWGAYFYSGSVSNYDKSLAYYVRAVRGGSVKRNG